MNCIFKATDKHNIAHAHHTAAHCAVNIGYTINFLQTSPFILFSHYKYALIRLSICYVTA